MNTPDAPTIECHPPERRRRTEIRMCHGSCCCCCCCLHTVGGLIGAAVAPGLGGETGLSPAHLALLEYWEEEGHEPSPATGARTGPEAITGKGPVSPARPTGRAGALPNISQPRVSAVRVFWLLSLVAVVLGALWGATLGDTFIVGIISVLLVFPAVQLVCAIITAIWLGLSSRPDKAFQFKQLGKVTAGLFLGTLAGILVMVGLVVLFSGR